MTAQPSAPAATPIKVVRIIARLNVGGPARHTAILSDGLTPLGFDTVLVHGSCEEGEASMEHLLEGSSARVMRVPELGRSVRPLDDARAFLALCRVLWRERPAIVHTHTAKAGTLGRLAAWAYNRLHARERRVLIVHTFHGHVLHGYFSARMSRLVRLIERLLARVSDVIIAISPAQRDDLVDRFNVADATQVVVVPLGLELGGLLESARDQATARQTLQLPGTAFVVAFVGRLVPIKDVPTLVRAFARVRARVPHAHLAIVGNGPSRPELESLVHELGLRPHVTWLGWRDDLDVIYAAADVVALSSRNEGTPVALIEAMAAGRAVVATAVGGVADVVRHEQTGLVVAAGHAEALAAALERMAHDPALRREWGARGREEARARFGSDRLRQDVAALYRARLGREWERR